MCGKGVIKTGPSSYQEDDEFQAAEGREEDLGNLLAELLPYLEQHYAFRPKAENSYVAGFSLSGLLAFDLAWLRAHNSNPYPTICLHTKQT